MLAKDLKIKNIKKQKSFIHDQIVKRLEHPRNDGDTAYVYIGHILPEVITHFENEGFTIVPINSDSLTALAKGLPVYRFTISQNVTLNEEELKAAEEIDQNENDYADNFTEELIDFLSCMFD